MLLSTEGTSITHEDPMVGNKALMQGIQKTLSSSDSSCGLDAGISGRNPMSLSEQELRQDKWFLLTFVSLNL